MSNETNTIFVVFNGEIYNHKELREKISRYKRHLWKTHHSDTEVIIHAYEEWGIEFINELRGQFAIGLYDSNKRICYLIRDRSGIKPLYYTFINGQLIFASEIKAILKNKRLPRSLNEEAFYHYLSFLTTPAPMTLFENINKVPSGCYLAFSELHNPVLTTYYDILDHINIQENQNEFEVAEKLVTQLRDAVKSHSVSDVPVGIFLSGGIDSSTNAALFSEDHSDRIKTFTIGYDKHYSSYPNETKFAQIMANRINAEYYEKLLSLDDLVEFLPQMIYLQDEPIADPVCVPLYYVSKLARENGVIVCQVGEGSDELFHGYSAWHRSAQLDFRLGIIPNVVKRMLHSLINHSRYKNSDHNEFLRRNISSQPIFWGGAEYASNNNKHRILSDRLRLKFKKHSSWEVIKPYYDNFINKSPTISVANWMTYIDLKYRLPELLLMRVDKMSMGVSIETRVPFLDHQFVEFAYGISPQLKVKDGISKYILKRSVRGLIPDELINRKKQGFGIPVNDWLHQSLGEKMIEEVRTFVNRTDLFNSAEVELDMQKKDSFSWLLYNFVMWHNKFID